MTNNEFILGLIELGVQKGYVIPDRNTDTKFLDKGMFTFLYNGDIIKLERDNRGMGMAKKNEKHFFTIILDNRWTKNEIYFISEETYKAATNYFYSSNYKKLKKNLKSDLRKTKIKNIEKKT